MAINPLLSLQVKPVDLNPAINAGYTAYQNAQKNRLAQAKAEQDAKIRAADLAIEQRRDTLTALHRQNQTKLKIAEIEARNAQFNAQHDLNMLLGKSLIKQRNVQDEHTRSKTDQNRFNLFQDQALFDTVLKERSVELQKRWQEVQALKQQYAINGQNAPVDLALKEAQIKKTLAAAGLTNSQWAAQDLKNNIEQIFAAPDRAATLEKYLLANEEKRQLIEQSKDMAPLEKQKALLAIEAQEQAITLKNLEIDDTQFKNKEYQDGALFRGVKERLEASRLALELEKEHMFIPLEFRQAQAELKQLELEIAADPLKQEKLAAERDLIIQKRMSEAAKTQGLEDDLAYNTNYDFARKVSSGAVTAENVDSMIQLSDLDQDDAEHWKSAFRSNTALRYAKTFEKTGRAGKSGGLTFNLGSDEDKPKFAVGEPGKHSGDFAMVYGDDQMPTLVPLEGSDSAIEREELAKKAKMRMMNTAAVVQTQINNMDLALSKVDWTTAGLASIVEIPGTDGVTLQALIENHIKGSEALRALQALKDSAQNGASGLGQVTIREFDALSSLLAPTDRKMQGKDLKHFFGQIRGHMIRLHGLTTGQIQVFEKGATNQEIQARLDATNSNYFYDPEYPSVLYKATPQGAVRVEPHEMAFHGGVLQ